MKIIMSAVLIICVIQLLYSWLAPTDSTDKSKWNRSGLVIYTDAKTGVQYLGKPGFFSPGTIVLRVDKNGKPVTENINGSK